MTLIRTNTSVRPAVLLHVLGVAVLVALVVFASTPRPARASLEKMSDLDVLELINNSKGKVMVINFFATWCGPCRMEIPELIDIREDFAKEDVLVVGLAVDDTEPALRRFTSDMGFNYPVYMAESSVARLFNVEGVPMVLVYSPEGKLIDTQIGYRPGHVRELVEENLPQ